MLLGKGGKNDFFNNRGWSIRNDRLIISLRQYLGGGFTTLYVLNKVINDKSRHDVMTRQVHKNKMFLNIYQYVLICGSLCSKTTKKFQGVLDVCHFNINSRKMLT